MLKADLYAGCIQLCGKRIAFYSNENRFNTYLCELFNLDTSCAQSGCLEIQFIYDENGKSSDVSIRYEAGKVIVNEKRKKLICEPKQVQCIIYANVKSAEALYYTYVLPSLKTIFAENDILTLHASAFRTQKGTCAAFVSPSGCGKTSLSVLMMKYGAQILTDDLFFIDINQEKIWAFPRPAHVDISLCKWFTWLEEWIAHSQPYMSGSNKYNLRFFERDDISYCFEMPLPDIIFFPVIGNKESTYAVSVSERAALIRIMSQIYFNPHKNCREAAKLIDKYIDNSKVLYLGNDVILEPQKTAMRILDIIDSEVECKSEREENK